MDKVVGRNLVVHRDSHVGVAFGCGHPELVYWVEKHFPWGVWVRDPDGTPLYSVAGVMAGNEYGVGELEPEEEGE